MALPNAKSYGVGDMNERQKQGRILPEMTTAERDALDEETDLFAGLVIYNTTTNKINFYTGAAWEVVTSA